MKRELADLFVEKRREFGTLKRVYCAEPACSRFLGGQKPRGWIGNTIYTCTSPTCTTWTCSSCKAKAIGYMHICKTDDGEAQFLEVSQREGWSRCPGCNQMIELDIGCHHMTCRCKTEFCYLCRARWKTCSCPQWDERQLLAVAEARVNAWFGLAMPIQDRPQQVPRNRLRPEVVLPAAARPAQTRAPTVAAVRTTKTNKVTVAPVAHMPLANIQSSRPSVSAAANPRKGKKRADGHQGALKSESITDHRARLVRGAMEDLRMNHECNHNGWEYRQGGGKCQNCHQNLPIYLFVSSHE
jgi:hypothetical protein